MAGITLATSTPASISTPSTGKVTLFSNSSDSNIPYYKDDAGSTHTLQGPTGSTGAAATGDDANTVLGAFIFGG